MKKFVETLLNVLMIPFILGLIVGTIMIIWDIPYGSQVTTTSFALFCFDVLIYGIWFYKKE